MMNMHMGNSINEGNMAHRPKLTSIKVKKPKPLEFLIEGVFITTLNPKKLNAKHFKSKNFLAGHM
jgi:hypothetical protein